jgi:hypothetical protein
MPLVQFSELTMYGSGFSIEASDLALPPGKWPDWIAVHDTHRGGQLFARYDQIRHNGEFGGWIYRSGDCYLHVLND